MGFDAVEVVKDPIKFAKKKPIIVAGGVGIALLLVYLFKPANETGLVTASYEPISESGGISSGSGSIGDLTEPGISPDELSTALDDMATWVTTSLDKYARASSADMAAQLNDQLQTTNVIQSGSAGNDMSDILVRIAANAERARDLYVDTWNTPELNALHQENLSLAASIGGVYNPATGEYTYNNISGPPKTSTNTFDISNREDKQIINADSVSGAVVNRDSSGKVTSVTASNGVSSKVAETSGGKKVTTTNSGVSTVGDKDDPASNSYVADGKGGWKQVG